MSAKQNGTLVATDGAASPNNTSSRLDVPMGPSKIQGHPSSQFLLPPSTITPTPARTSRTIAMDPSTPSPASRNPSDKTKGKRKAEDIDTTPPEQKKDAQRATFAVPESNRTQSNHTGQKLSAASHAPSSYHRKRARISTSSLFGTPIHSRPVSIQGQSVNLERTPEVGKFGSWSSQTSARVQSNSRAPSRATSTRSARPQQTPSRNSHTTSIAQNQNQNHTKHQSMSQASIPISALVSPHAPSIATSGKFHMRDPRRPPKKLAETPWTLHFREEDEPGSPVHAWYFFLGFILFPLWWIAALLRTPRTRVVGDEKGVSLDDPQIEHDAKAWRFRCRVMSVVSLFTYIPFIILVVLFVGR
ncbi:hypothetical protein DEU56DRAFT_450119 [Suillus clintonianus]|uniref:uncharacterized protein n=1 Tax=Suillus clintonianus TaxID=1904413 RepID=UPI001B8861A4|nr:uncharacterized protein DEU56DRAFT_450119 [Suillus clintonianus]KAG2131772.1 hypothetical protein DEU56DRAFT_450119 [Suillus clintonianus]